MDFLNNKNIRCNTSKSSVLFAVTVPYTKISKEEAYDELKIFCIKLIISKEKHLKQKTYHHHLYFRTKQKFLFMRKGQFILEHAEMSDNI